VILTLNVPGETGRWSLRPWRMDDAPSLVEHASDRRVSRNMRDVFPYPYGPADAERFLSIATAMTPQTFFAIAVDEAAVGGIGVVLHTDVERVSAEIGYWLGTAFKGRGVTTAAVRATTAFAFREFDYLARVYAVPFAWNDASARVLEKAGYRLEGRLRRSAIKDGEVVDQLMYSILREEHEPSA
jgi:ribosomal-protein-alanine N-acetyltransferase